MPSSNMTPADIAKVNANFDKIIANFKLTATKVKLTMPLLAQSLELNVAITKVYKEAFNSGRTTK